VVVHPERGVEARRDIGFFEHDHPTIVHDRLAAYDTYSAPSHAHCGAHLLCHLDDVGQTLALSAWTQQMAGILCAARDASAAAADTGLRSVPADITARLTAELRATLEVAFALLPAGTPPRRRHRGGWNHAQRKGFDLATRRPNNHDQVLRLLATPRSGPPTTTPSAHYPRSRSTTRPPAPSNQPREPPAPPPCAPSSKPPNTHCHNLPDARRQPFSTRPRSPPAAAVIT